MHAQRTPHDTPSRSDHGSALVMVVLALLAVSGLATAMMILGQTNQLVAANERDSERALAASKAGLSYGYKLFQDGAIEPDTSGEPFDSFDTDVAAALEGAEFAGSITEMSAAQGQLYAIQSTGTFNRASRTTEMVVQIVPESLKYGFIGFNEVTLHNHSGLAGPSFRIQSTIFSDGSVSVPAELTLEGSIVAADNVSIDADSIVKYDVFANAVSNKGTIEGDVKTVTSTVRLPADATVFARKDAYGNKYNWFLGNSVPGTISGTGTILGQKSSYAIKNGDIFDTNVFYDDGSLIMDPKINVVNYVGPPLLDYKAMKAEADKNDPTYFTTATALYDYLRTKKVTETIGGFNVTTVRVGTPAKPEFIYLDGSFALTLSATGSDTGSAIKAHGFVLEGGMYVSGSWEVSETPYVAPPSAIMPPPPDYYSFVINALPYCYPAILSYGEPTSGTIATWKPEDTPALGTGSIDMKSGSPNGGFSLLNGLVFSGGDIHLHHTKNNLELIRFNGAEMAGKIHNCDYMWFSYDPAVRCTKFLSGAQGTPGVVSYREIR